MAAGATFNILWRIIDHMSVGTRISGLRQRELLDNKNANAAGKLHSWSSACLGLGCSLEIEAACKLHLDFSLTTIGTRRIGLYLKNAFSNH